MYLKEPDLNDIIKKLGSIKIYLSAFVSNFKLNTCEFLQIINYFSNCSDLVYDRGHSGNDIGRKSDHYISN